MVQEKQIRICQVLHGIVGGGSEQVVLNYCSRMRDIHFDLLYQYEPNPQILERFNEAGINCIQIPDKVHHPLRHLWTVFRIFRKGKYDVVHSHLDWFMNSYVCFLAMLAGIKKRIAHHHQAYGNNLLCSLMRIPCKLFATHWLACGEAAAINGWGRGAFKKGKVTILPNAIDPGRFRFSVAARRAIRAKYEIAEDDFVVGHVGRFYPQKNHDFLIDVFAELHKRKANAKLLLLGDGPLLEHIKQKVESLGLSNKVIFAGLQKDVAPFYSAMDVFAFPSLWEGLPLTLVEAQYAGLPCIVSENVTRDVAITDSIRFVPLDDVVSWSEKICSLEQGDNTRLLEIKNRAFDIRFCCKTLESFYQIP